MFVCARVPESVVARMFGLFAMGVATVPLAACSGTPTRLTLTSAAPAPNVSFAAAIARARSARNRAALMIPPATADIAAASDDAVSTLLRNWASSRRDATQEAHRAYTEALRAAASPAEEADVYAELAEMWLRLAEDTRSALFASTPLQYQNEPSFTSAVQSATVFALRPLLDRVETHLSACQRVVRESPSAVAAAKTCDAVAQRLNEVNDPRPRAPRVEPEVIARRPILPTTHPKPCTFKGTLLARGTIYADESGSSVMLPMTSATPIEVESLAVPRAPGGRYKVVVTWPQAVEGYLQADDGPFALTRPVELAPGTVWAKEGDRVAVSDARGPTVRAVPANGDPRAKPTGKHDALERRLFCHDLELATAPVRISPTDGSH